MRCGVCRVIDRSVLAGGEPEMWMWSVHHWIIVGWSAGSRHHSTWTQAHLSADGQFVSATWCCATYYVNEIWTDEHTVQSVQMRNFNEIVVKQFGKLLQWRWKMYTHTHTHTHPFNGPFSGTTRVSRYQKGKTNLDFTGARDSEWQWHQLSMCKSAPHSRQITTSAPHHSVFYRPDALPAAQPTASKHWRHL